MSAVEPTPQEGASRYWYPDADRVAVLRALRRFRRSDEEMRRRVSADMDMNARDLKALQHVIAGERTGEPATPRAVAAYLGISTASTTTLLDRLTVSGYLQRRPHPTDRRSVVIVATGKAHDEIRARMAAMHERMAAVADAVPEHCRPAVVAFLEQMADEMDRDEGVAPLTGDEGVAPLAGGEGVAPLAGGKGVAPPADGGRPPQA